MRLLAFALLIFATATGQQANNQKHPPVGAKKNPKPECDPKTDWGMAINAQSFTCSPDGKWVENYAAEKAVRDDDNRKRQLLHLMQVRALTPKEEKEADDYGDSLNTFNLEPYQADEKQKELNNAWYQQSRLKRLEMPCESAVR